LARQVEKDAAEHIELRMRIEVVIPELSLSSMDRIVDRLPCSCAPAMQNPDVDLRGLIAADGGLVHRALRIKPIRTVCCVDPRLAKIVQAAICSVHICVAMSIHWWSQCV
jgi:hypothetical protein